MGEAKRRKLAGIFTKPEKLMFCVSAPPLNSSVTYETEMKAFGAAEAMIPGLMNDRSVNNNQDRAILVADKDMIRAIYYGDIILHWKKTVDLFVIQLALSVILWEQTLTAQQKASYERAGLHHLTIENINDDSVHWHWTLNRNNPVNIQTRFATVSPVSNLEIKPGVVSYAPIEWGFSTEMPSAPYVN
jgi:hypothetical protein